MTIREHRLSVRWIFGGRVQGVGFRPFVYRLAKQFGANGWVRNRHDTVEIVVQPLDENAVSDLRQNVLTSAPFPAAPVLLQEERLHLDACSDFRILGSTDDVPVIPVISPDQSICELCLQELHNPQSRRYRDPFIQCAQCGPRLTVIERFPFERENTVLDTFPPCDQCQREYQNDRDRRFYAQNQMCPHCGPRYSLTDGVSIIEDTTQIFSRLTEHLNASGIATIKGLGGYHIVCDASSISAIETLRQIKQRPHKPFAVMVPYRDDDEFLKKIATFNECERETICSASRPIVILKRSPTCTLPEQLSPGLNTIGVMYPYTGFYQLLLDHIQKPLVVTSANTSGQALIYRDHDIEAFHHQIPMLVTHSRKILRPVEDSVVHVVNNRVMPLRLSRGILPLDIKTPYWFDDPVVALGGHKKNAIAFAYRDRIALTSYSGDLDNFFAFELFEKSVKEIQSLYGVTPKTVICDAHPHYAQRAWLREKKIDAISVFHHRAHASAMFAQQKLSKPCLAVVWDGIGFGEDGSLWGGESFIGTPGHWRRVASLKPFRLIGGDRAAYEPSRVAAALCWEADLNSYREQNAWRAIWHSGEFSPMCSSVGRLFDGVAALVGFDEPTSYEAQAAMRLESYADVDTHAGLELPSYRDKGIFRLDWRPLVPLMGDATRSREERSTLFHASLALAILNQALAWRGQNGIDTVALCGGVFQNRVLSELTRDLLSRQGFYLIESCQYPANDSALAIGQLIEWIGAKT